MIPGWEREDGKEKKRLVVSVAALQKVGKSHFSLTAPGPLAYFDLNKGSEGVIGKFIKDKEIYRSSDPYTYYSSDNRERYVQTWERYKKDYYTFLSNPKIRSLVIDTNTESWELCRLARLGKVSQVSPNAYGPVNAEYGDMIEKGLDSGKNILYIHTMGDQYVGTITPQGKEISVRTGKLKTNYYKEMPYLVQVVVQLMRNDTETEVEDRFGLRIVDCRKNPGANGVELWGSLCRFSYLAATVFGDDPGEWEG
jgi:hypothetical protein